jgi:formyltetrahydrofolate-dependent phosphoribosylglycinamide formyltransferase
MKKLAVLVSGVGSTLRNLCEHIASGNLQAKVALVITNNTKAAKVIRDWRLDLITLNRADQEMNDLLFRVCAGIDLVVMAGWNRLLTIPEEFKGRVINIHPSLLPKYGGKGFYGLKVHEAVLTNKETESGCTVHIADNEYDHGPILAQEKVLVLPDDTAESLQKRVQEAERFLYPKVIQEYLLRDSRDGQ